jgi:hypothetical protein
MNLAMLLELLNSGWADKYRQRQMENLMPQRNTDPLYNQGMSLQDQLKLVHPMLWNFLNRPRQVPEFNRNLEDNWDTKKYPLTPPDKWAFFLAIPLLGYQTLEQWGLDK